MRDRWGWGGRFPLPSKSVILEFSISLLSLTWPENVSVFDFIAILRML